MKEILIVCRSITYAQRASRAIGRVGVSHQILRLPAGVVNSGCGYAVRVRKKRCSFATGAVRVRSSHLRAALRAMAQEGMQPSALFVWENGAYREVRHDLS